jgi:hypothetical protein
MLACRYEAADSAMQNEGIKAHCDECHNIGDSCDADALEIEDSYTSKEVRLLAFAQQTPTPEVRRFISS